MSPVSGDLLSRLGPRKCGQSTPLERVQRLVSAGIAGDFPAAGSADWLGEGWASVGSVGDAVPRPPGSPSGTFADDAVAEGPFEFDSATLPSAFDGPKSLEPHPRPRDHPKRKTTLKRNRMTFTDRSFPRCLESGTPLSWSVPAMEHSLLVRSFERLVSPGCRREVDWLARSDASCTTAIFQATGSDWSLGVQTTHSRHDLGAGERTSGALRRQKAPCLSRRAKLVPPFRRHRGVLRTSKQPP